MNNKTSNFKKGDTVRYSGAGRAETGTVTSTNSTYVFCDTSGYGKSEPKLPGELTKV